jgi:lipoate-protein ligase B
MMRCDVFWLGTVDYGRCLDLQNRLWRARLERRIPDALLMLEHRPVVTLGKAGKLENVLVSREELAARGISLFFTDRGGDVTYHGPGQLVAYPIFDLRERGRDLHRFLFDLEEVVIRTLRDFKIEGGRDEGHPGIWVEGEEIAALGLKASRWVTTHGVALNVNNDLGPFCLINPCGFADRRATSMAAMLGVEVSFEEVRIKLLSRFAEVFSLETVEPAGDLTRELA